SSDVQCSIATSHDDNSVACLTSFTPTFRNHSMSSSSLIVAIVLACIAILQYSSCISVLEYLPVLDRHPTIHMKSAGSVPLGLGTPPRRQNNLRQEALFSLPYHTHRLLAFVGSEFRLF